MSWPTFATVVSAAGQELGLFVSAVADPFASTDRNVLQLNALLNKLGRQLARRYQWSQLERTHYFPAVVGQNHYPLPSDYSRLISGTIWNRTTTWKSTEGASPQLWRALKDSAIASSAWAILRITGNRFWIHPEPTSADVFAFEYQSLNWVESGNQTWAADTAYTVGEYVLASSVLYVCVTAGTSASAPATGPSGTGDTIADGTAVWDFVGEAGVFAPTLEVSATKTDALWFDKDLLVAGLKLEFKTAKGFDTAAAVEEFNQALSAARGGDGMPTPLRVGGNQPGLHLIDKSNIPETGYGV